MSNGEDSAITAEPGQSGERELGRIGAFSDAVFAIAMTLLVLNIDVPNIPDSLVSKELPKQLKDILWADLLAYFLSFAVIALYWRAHHALLASIKRYDGKLITLNFIFLAFIALVPFPTELLSEYAESSYAVATYAGTLACVGFEVVAIDYYANIAGLKAVTLSRSTAFREALSDSVPAFVFLASIPLAFVLEGYTPFLWLLILFTGPVKKKISPTYSRKV